MGNVREQHSNRAIGKLVDISFDDDRKAIPVTCHVVDDAAWAKVVQGVYSGFSIGGRYLRKWADGSLIRYEAQPAEISLVDSPCIPSAIITAVKRAPTELEEITARVIKTAAVVTAHVKRISEAQGANLEELNPTKFKNVCEWKEAIARAELAKALKNGQPASFEGGHTKSNFKTLQTGERGKATHYVDVERKGPFQPR